MKGTGLCDQLALTKLSLLLERILMADIAPAAIHQWSMWLAELNTAEAGMTNFILQMKNKDAA